MWVKTLQDKTGKTVAHGFTGILNKSNVSQIDVDWRKEFYDSPTQKWLDNSNILMYTTHNTAKSVVAERFVKTLKESIFKKKI